jgi:tetratricopeptide (TPR) repeat protein
MNVSRIIKILSITAIAWAIAGETSAWTRHRPHRHHILSPYHHHFHHPHYCYPEYVHDYRPQYTEQDGWEQIKKNRSDTALEIFENASDANPAAGGPKIGIAIAAADIGLLSKSIIAMRQALRYNPGALQLFEPEEWLKHRLKKLIKKYQGRSHGLRDQDAYFMAAVFNYMLKNKDGCLEAVRLGKKADDTSDSALNLFSMAEKDTWRFR